MEAPPAVVRCAAWLMSGSLLSLTTAAAQPVDRADRMPVISAVPATSAIDVDGRLDDPDWHRVLPITSFTQVEPIEGRPASERTEVRVVFDDRYLYFGVVCHDSGGDLRVRDLRRDFDDTTDDFFGISIDGVGDGRSALVFRVNARGALRDQQTVDGGLADVDFDAVWIARTARQDDGWTAEVAIPWQSLRYRIGQEAWSLNFQRVIRRKNENVGWSPWPRALQPFRMDYAGRLTGLQPPPPGAIFACSRTRWSRPWTAPHAAAGTGSPVAVSVPTSSGR
jgi:hypothetical protein